MKPGWLKIDRRNEEGSRIFEHVNPLETELRRERKVHDGFLMVFWRRRGTSSCRSTSGTWGRRVGGVVLLEKDKLTPETLDDISMKRREGRRETEDETGLLAQGRSSRESLQSKRPVDL